MGYLNKEDIDRLGFKSVGKDVRISDRAAFYDCEKIQIGDYSRIDDFCLLSGRISIGKYCHITPMCLIAGGQPGVFLSDFCTLAYGVKIFSQSDDYSGDSLTNSMMPKEFKQEIYKSVTLERLVIVGAGATILPGANIAEGCAVGAMALVKTETAPWGIYAGVPAKRIKERSNLLLEKLSRFRQNYEES